MNNTTLKIAVDCKIPTIWIEPHPSGSGVTWQGEPAWRFDDIKSSTGLEYDVVAGSVKGKVEEGIADVTINTYGINQENAKAFDYTYPTAEVGVFIISGKGDDVITGNVLKGIFDDATYCMAGISLATMILVTWLILKRENSCRSFSHTVLHLIGNMFMEQLPASMMPRTFMGAMWILLVPIYNMMIAMMYSSIIISLLTVIVEKNVINTMADLNRTENENVRIFINERSFIPNFLKSANMLTGFENRTDYFINKKDDELVLDSIRNGSHVLIGPFWFFRNMICRVNKKAGRELTTTQDFWKSTEPLFTTWRGMLMRKKYPHAENINKGLIWFHALGFWQIRDVSYWYSLDLRRNGGIWAKNPGKCKNRGRRKTCKLIPKMDFNLRTKNIRARVC